MERAPKHIKVVREKSCLDDLPTQVGAATRLSHPDVMHAVFTIPELTQAIVENVVQTVTDGDRRAILGLQRRFSELTDGSWEDLKSLGMTARTFREPCLNAVWRTQTSLVPLLRSVGVIARSPSADAPVFYVQDEYICTKLLRLEDVRKMWPYASRIKCFALSSAHVLRMEGNQFHEVVPQAVIFPALRSLLWCSASKSFEVLFILRTMGANLTLCKGSMSNTILLELSEKATSLADLTISGSTGEDSDIRLAQLALLRASAKLSKVKIRLEGSQDSRRLWQALAKLPVLDTFHLGEIEEFRNDAGEVISFAPLMSLGLSVCNTVPIIKILRSSLFPSLEKLGIFSMMHLRPSAAQIAALFKTIASSCVSNTLMELNVTFMLRGPDASPDLMLDARVLRPLFSHTNMRDLDIRVAEGILIVDDQLLLDMLHAWPNLRHLSLNPCPDRPDIVKSSELTFKVLDAVGNLCPLLQHFGAIFSCNFLATPTPQPHLVKESTSLKKLDVGLSPIEDSMTAAAAAYLSCLFPSLETVVTGKAYTEDAEEVFARWELVSELVPAMVQIRREERMSNTLRGSSGSGDS